MTDEQLPSLEQAIIDFLNADHEYITHLLTSNETNWPLVATYLNKKGILGVLLRDQQEKRKEQ